MSEWKRYKLGELLRVKHGWAFKGEFFSETGIQSILTPGNFYESGGFKANTSKDRFYIGEYPKEYLCSKGDLIVAMTEQAAGLLGSTAIVPEDNRYLHNQRIGLISCNEYLNKDFAYYLFMTQTIRQQISRSASGTKVKHTSPEKIYEVQVYIPKIQTQRNIAKILTTLDQKIQTNNQINQELEAMAKTLYDYWFVQFDFPDQNGKPYKSSGGKMVYHPELKREIPEGWGVEKLKYFSKYVSDKVESSELNIENYVGTDNMIVDMGGIELTTSIPKSGTSTKYSIGDILISNIRPYFKKIWLSDRVGGCSSDVLCIRTKKIVSREFVFATLARDDFFNYDVAGSKGSKMPRGDKKHIMEYPIVFDFEIADQFSKIVRPIYEAVHKNYIQNQELIQLRDWLLPMLMNGQVKVE